MLKIQEKGSIDPNSFQLKKSSFPVDKPERLSVVLKPFGIYKKDLTLLLDIVTTQLCQNSLQDIVDKNNVTELLHFNNDN